MRTGPILASLVVLLLNCHDDAVRGPKEWQDIAQKELSERLRTNYDSVYEYVGFIHASAGSRTDVYDVANGRVEHFFSLERGEMQGYEYEWYPDGAIWFVTNRINGDEDGTAVEFNYERGQQYIREYKLRELLSTDSVPLTDRPRIELFAPPALKTSM